MLQNVGEEILECYRRADEWRRRANAATDPAKRDDCFTMEQRWLYLARSYEFCRRLADFTAYARTWKRPPWSNE